MRDYQNASAEKAEDKVGKKGFHWRLAPPEVGLDLGGYSHNSVTPFMLNQSMPLVVPDSLCELSPQVFYLGAGDIDIKIRVGLTEFLEKSEYQVIMGDILNEK
jgi:prolyl-tRNA editing enzyme YbaK/EbsC (Cys-tRNA(Pro) deacylase)